MQLYRIFSFIVVAFLSVSIQAHEVYLLPATQTVDVGDTVTVELWWDFSTEPTLGGGVDIGLDPALLDYSSFTFNSDTALDVGFNRLPDDLGSTLLGIAAGNFNTGIVGPIKIGTVSFSALAAGVATLSTNENAGPVGPFFSISTFTPYFDINFNAATITINPVISPAVCGDAIQEFGEQCDDGNATGGDGCSSSCQVEQPDFVCTDAIPPNFDDPSNPIPSVPSVCTFLQDCAPVEQFEAGFPAWTILNLSIDPADGWGTSTDGICASQNWIAPDPSNNVTGGGGLSACADSDATGQIDIDGGMSANEMNSYLCSPALDLSQVTDPYFSFLANYQALSNDVTDNDFLKVLVGTSAPNALTIGGYTEILDIMDQSDTAVDISDEIAHNVSLLAQNGASTAYACLQYRATYAWFAQIDNAALRGSVCQAPDKDGDGVADYSDNCTQVSNADQRDTDGDGYGNACDADLNNNCIVSLCSDFADASCITSGTDEGLMKAVFFTNDPDADLNNDGVVNFADLGILRSYAGQPPGPSGVINTCDIGPLNSAPVANGQSVTTPEDTPKPIVLSGSDNENDILIFSVVTSPSNGMLAGAGNNFIYTPNANFNGADSFTFKVNDTLLDSDIATVSIEVTPVNDPPVADNDSYSVSEDSPLSIPAPGVLTNDNDIENNTLTSSLDSNVSNGILVLNTDGSFTYAPNTNFCGSDSFSYHASDGMADSNIASVNIDVVCVNDAPTANGQSISTDEDTNLAITLTGTDIENSPLTYIIVSNPGSGQLIGTDANLTYQPNANFNGSDSFSFKVNDGEHDSNIATVSITIDPVNDAPTIMLDHLSQTVQYSDPVSVSISSADIDSSNLSLVTSTLPAGLILSTANCDVGAPPAKCDWTVSGNIQAAPGTYQIQLTVTDNGELSDATVLTASASFTIIVEQEDARSSYTGPLFLGSAKNGDFSVTLMATIRDISAVPGDAATDAYAGDIRNATVSFVNETGVTLCSASVVNLVFSANTTIGSASCEYSGSLGNNEELSLEVTTVVDNYYTDTSDNEVVVFIVKPGDGKITGGGQLELDNSAGIYTADPELRTNYGFTAQEVKKGKKNTQLKGRATIILRADDGHKYKIRSNALLSLGIDLGSNKRKPPYYAEFESKANLIDITDPLYPIGLGGNLLLQLRMTDNGEPGENDTLSLSLWDEGTLLFSSNWDGARSVEQNVARGNLQVH